MDRLSSYAAREAESEPSEDRKNTEEEATARLLQKLRISKDIEATEPQTHEDGSKQTNGETINGHKPTETPSIHVDGQSDETAAGNIDAVEDDKPVSRKKRGIPEEVKLYEVFYEQVINLVNAQRLHIQDTIALLVSLSNLAL